MDTTALKAIEAAVRRLVPAGVASSVGAIAAAYPQLPAAEHEATSRMRASRLQEFTAGRAQARAVLQELGLSSPVVAVGHDRSPVWPPGFVGSISHAGQVALAVAAPSALIRAIGIDLEPCVPLDRDLLNRVCRPAEIARLEVLPAPLHQAKLIFSAKESVYKCLAPLTGVFMDFDDLEILLRPGEGAFTVCGHGPGKALTDSSRITGRFAEAGGYWTTVAWQWRGTGLVNVDSGTD